MKNKNFYTFFANNKISKVFILLICCAFFSFQSNAANNNFKMAGSLTTIPNPNDTVYPLQLSLSAHVYSNTFNVSCFGFKDGSIDLTVNGGTPPYIYQWSEGDTIEDITDLPAGYYKVTVIDADSNSSWAEITLRQPTPLNKLKTEFTLSKYPNNYNVSCTNCYNGSITVDVFGGSGMYIYAWKDDSLATLHRTGLGAGIYFISIKDTNACSGGDAVNLNIPLKEPPNNGWSMEGNGNLSASQFIGTTDESDLVFRTNNTTQMQLTHSSNTGTKKIIITGDGEISDNFAIGKKLDVAGNISTGGKLITSRITTMDSVVYIGDSCIAIDGNNNRIYGIHVPFSPPSEYEPEENFRTRLSLLGCKGIGIGKYATANYCNSFAVGYNSTASKPLAMAFGSEIVNDIENSFMVGFNNSSPNLPTFFVGPSNTTGTGSVGIGTINFAKGNDLAYYKLAVYGNIHAKEVVVEAIWSDFVFEKNYNLTPLAEVEKYIHKYKHLPDVPSASEVKENGVSVGENQALLLKKIEELTLYVIELNKKNEELQKKLEQIEKSLK